MIDENKRQNKQEEPFYSKDQFSQLYLKGKTEAYTYRVFYDPVSFEIDFTDDNVPNVPFSYNFNYRFPLTPDIQTQEMFIMPTGGRLIDVIVLGTSGQNFRLRQFREPNPSTGTVGGFATDDLVDTIAMTAPVVIRPPVNYNHLKPLDRLVVTAPAGTFITFVIKYT